MEQELITTYSQIIRDPRLLEISKECGIVYNLALNSFWNHYNQTNDFLSSYDIQKQIYSKIEVKYLHSDTKIGIIQSFRDAINSWLQSKKEYPNNHNIKPPYKEKSQYCIIFKQSAIRYKDGYLYFSLKRPNEPIKMRWNKKVNIPHYAIISYDKTIGWKISLVIKYKVDINNLLDKDKVMACDLGIKRICTTFNGENIITYSGKIIMSLTRLRNKIYGKTQEKLSKLKKHSKKYKRIKRGYRSFTRRNKNKIKDILHKTSRTIVNNCVENKIGTIVFGDCSGIHKNVNLGKENNQKINQNPEQRLRKYVENKFEVIGGTINLIPENYTSRTCPKCGYVKDKSPSGRTFKCNNCDFVYDRDGVGGINIFNKYKKVSFGDNLNVVGSLTLPIGWKYHSNHDCLINKC